MTAAGFIVDLNADRAARREKSGVAELKVTLGDDSFTLPAELPIETFSPFRELLTGDEITSLIASVGTPAGEAVFRELGQRRPELAVGVLDALRLALGRLFCSGIAGAVDPPVIGCDIDHVTEEGKPDPLHHADCQWPRFLKQRPSGPDFIALGRGLLAGYGVSLGEALRSSGSAGSGGRTSKPTSKRTSASTPGKRSSTPAKKASSA